MFHLKELEKEQMKPKVSKTKEKARIKVEINELKPKIEIKIIVFETIKISYFEFLLIFFKPLFSLLPFFPKYSTKNP